MRIALYQGPGGGSVPGNLEVMARHAREAAESGAELLVLPEMFLTGYNIGTDTRALAEPADGPSARKAAALAKEHGLALCYGFPERDGDAVYNSLLLVGPDGSPLASYRKAHLFGPYEQKMFAPGDELAVVRLGGWSVGLAICYDIEFPEMIRSLALAGAELVLCPTALMEPYGFVAETVVPCRSWENQVFAAYANRSGSEGELTYCGLSCVAAPDGTVLTRAGKGEELLLAELDRQAVDAARKVNPYLADRRPSLYASPVKQLP